MTLNFDLLVWLATPTMAGSMSDIVELVDERFTAIKRQHLPSYLDLLKNWRESLKSTEEWMVKKEQEFAQYADEVIAQYEKGHNPIELHDHTYTSQEEGCSFIPHYCSNQCWTVGYEVRSPSKYSSLSLPLLLGWRRVLMFRPASEGNRVDAYYTAPCGRRLRSMEEVQLFLESTCPTVTRCNVGITNFTFDPFCSLICPPYNAKSAGAKVFIPDITCNSEPIPITCVNSISAEPPEHFQYINQRIVGPGVHIEEDPGFLVSCSCTDNCANRSKCECWQLTLQEARTVGPTKHSVGYVHGRLRRPQHSAIYECNRLCSCGPKCGNRVVQKGVEHHLQVFRTEDRGWGLRTLRDIPAGSFICTYVGQIFPEHTLESQGQEPPTPISDEYFAELDYIEVMEHHKEGYESEVEPPPSDFSSESNSDDEMYCVDSLNGTKLKLHKVPASETASHETASHLTSEDDQLSSYTPSNASLTSLSSSESPVTPLQSPTPHQTPPITTSSDTHTPSSVPSSHPHTITTSPHTRTPPLTSPRPGQLQLVNRTSNSPTDTPVSNRPTHIILSCPSANRSTPIQMDQTPPANQPPHPQTEQKIISPHKYLVPISPRKLHGMRTRQHFREDFSYIIDAKDKGNIGRYINHSCSPNMFVQNVFVDTHDLRFPWVAFFARNRIKTLQELTWDYSYEVGSVDGKVIYCHCKAPNCRGRLI